MRFIEGDGKTLVMYICFISALVKDYKEFELKKDNCQKQDRI